jgi:hypothetical protein
VVAKHRRSETDPPLGSAGAPVSTAELWPAAAGYDGDGAGPGPGWAAAPVDQSWQEWQDWHDWAPPPVLHPDHPSAQLPRVQFPADHPSRPMPAVRAPGGPDRPGRPARAWSAPPPSPEPGGPGRRRLHAVPDDAAGRRPEVTGLHRQPDGPRREVREVREVRGFQGEPALARRGAPGIAGQVLPRADGQAAQLAQEARDYAAAIREAAERDAAAIREAARREAAELRAGLESMSAELGRVAAYVAENLAAPAATAAALAPPAARPALPGPGSAPLTTRPARPDTGTRPPQPAARPAALPASPPARPATTPGRPDAPPAGQPQKQPRQRQAMRVASYATAALLSFAIATGAAEIGMHGFQFFVFRGGGVGQTPGSETDQQFLAREAAAAHHVAAPQGRHARKAPPAPVAHKN